MVRRLSSEGGHQIRKRIILPLLALATIRPAILSAQEETERADGSVEIDILATVDDLYGPEPPMEDCSDEQEAAIVSGEIVVCRRKQDQREFRTTGREAAQDRYAEETMNEGLLPTPDVAGGGIFRGPATVSGLCFIPPCPPPPALIIDVTALPKAPPGSDADRISRGLPPLGNDEDDEAPEENREDELGLPEIAE